MGACVSTGPSRKSERDSQRPSQAATFSTGKKTSMPVPIDPTPAIMIHMRDNENTTTGDGDVWDCYTPTTTNTSPDTSPKRSSMRSSSSSYDPDYVYNKGDMALHDGEKVVITKVDYSVSPYLYDVQRMKDNVMITTEPNALRPIRDSTRFSKSDSMQVPLNPYLRYDHMGRCSSPSRASSSSKNPSSSSKKPRVSVSSKRKSRSSMRSSTISIPPLPEHPAAQRRSTMHDRKSTMKRASTMFVPGQDMRNSSRHSVSVNGSLLSQTKQNTHHHPQPHHHHPQPAIRGSLLSQTRANSNQAVRGSFLETTSVRGNKSRGSSYCGSSAKSARQSMCKDGNVRWSTRSQQNRASCMSTQRRSVLNSNMDVHTLLIQRMSSV